MVEQKDNAIENIRNLLEKNKKALEVLEVLENKNKQYQKTKRYTLIMHLVAVTVIFAYLYFAYQMMSKSDCVFGNQLVVFFAPVIVVVAFLMGNIPQTKLEIDTTRMMQSTEIDFINSLLDEYVTYEDFPLIKAGNHYYIDFPDGMRKVSMRNVPYNEDTRMIGRKYHYKELRWNSDGFYLRETIDVKVCSNEQAPHGAGRIMSRGATNERISMEELKKSPWQASMI